MEDKLVRQERNRLSTRHSSTANPKSVNGHSNHIQKDITSVQMQPRLPSSDSGGESSASVSQDEVEKLRQMVKKLERQNRYLMKQQKQLIQQQKQLILPPQDSSICSSVTQDDIDRMSLLSHSTIVASIHAGAMNDDTSSILTASDYHSHHKASQPPVVTNGASSTLVQTLRESRSSHPRKQTVSTATKHPTSVQNVADSTAVNGKYAEDSWLYRVPKKPSNVDTSNTTLPATNTTQTTNHASEPPSHSVSDKGSLNQNTALSPVQWLREVFDSPQSLYMNSPARDWLLQRLDELRLTGRVSRWNSVSALSYVQTPQPSYPPSPMMTTPNDPRSHLLFDYHSNRSPSQTATFSRPVIKSTSFMSARNSVGSLGSLVTPFNSTQQPPRIRETPSISTDGPLVAAVAASHRRETLMAAMNNIAMNDVLAIARQQEEHLKAQAHAVIQQQRNSRSRSRPAQEERQPLPSQPTFSDRLLVENSQNSLPRNYPSLSSLK